MPCYAGSSINTGSVWRGQTMNRKSANPLDWGLQSGMDQSKILEGVTRYLRCSGQLAVKPDPETASGITVVAGNAIPEQTSCTLANTAADDPRAAEIYETPYSVTGPFGRMAAR